MALGIKMQLVNEQQIEQQYKNFLNELSNKYKISVGIDDSVVNNLKTQLSSILESFKKENLLIDNKQVENTVGYARKTFKEISKLSGEGYSDIQARVNEIRGSVDQYAKVVINTSKNTGKITSATITYKDAVGKVVNEYMKWDTALTKIDGKLTKQKTFKTVGYTFSEDFAKELNVNESIKQFVKSQELAIERLKIKYKDLLIPFKNEIDVVKQKIYSLDVKNPNLKNDMNRIAKDIQNIGVQAHNSSKSIDMANKSAMTLNDSVGLVLRKFAQWYVLGNLFMTIPHAIQNNIKFIRNMDDALTDLFKVVDLNTQQMKEMKNVSLDLGKSLGKSSADIMQGMAEFGRVTKDLEEIKQLTQTATMSSNVTDLSVAEASKALTTSLISFKMNFSESINLLNQWNEIQNNFRTSAKDIADGIGAVGSAAYQSKVKIQELEGFLTGIISTTGIDGSEAGTAIKSMISRIYRLPGTSDYDAGKAEQALKRIGVSIRGVNGDFRSFSEILKDVNLQFGNLSKTQQVAIAQAIGGTHHYSKFISLMNSFDIALKATEKAYNSQNSAIEENMKYLNSVSGRYEILKTNIEETFSNILESDILKSFLTLSTNVVQGVNSISKAFGGLSVAIGAIIPSLSLFKKEWALISFDTDLSKGGFLKGFSKSGILVNNLKEYKTVLSQLKLESGMYLNQSVSMGSTIQMLSMQFKALTGTTIAQTVATTGLRIASLALNSIIGMGIGYLVSVGISAITKYIEKQKQLKELTTDRIKSNQDEIETLSELINKREQLLKASNANKNEKELLEVNKELVKLFPSLKVYYDEKTGKLTAQKSVLEEIIKLKEAEAELDAKLINKRDSGSVKNDIEEYKKLAETLKGINEAVNKGIAYKSSRLVNRGKGKTVVQDVLSSEEIVSLKNKTVEAMQEIETRIYGLNDARSVLNKKLDDSNKLEIINLSSIKANALGVNLNTNAVENNTGAKQDNIDANYDMVESGEKLINMFEDATNNIIAYNDMIDELDENHKLSAQNINKIFKDYPVLLSYLGSEQELREQLIKLKDEEARKQRETYIQMIQDSEEFYNIRIKGNTELVNTLKDKYDIDLKNYKTLAEAKEKIESTLLNSLSEKWGMYFDTTRQALTYDYTELMRVNPEMAKQVYGDVVKYFRTGKEFNNIIGKFVSADFDAINLSKTGSGSKSLPTLKDSISQEDLTKELIKSYNKEVDITDQKLKHLERQLKINDEQKDYNKELEITNELISSQETKLSQLEEANRKIHQEANTLRKENKLGLSEKTIDSFFDVNGEASLAYKDYLNTFATETQRLRDKANKGSKESIDGTNKQIEALEKEKKQVEDLFNKIYALKKAWSENTTEVLKVNDILQDLQNSIPEIIFKISDQSYNKLKSQLEDLDYQLKLLDDDDKLSTIELLNEKIKLTETIVSDTGVEIAKLNEDFRNGKISIGDYNDRIDELNKRLRDGNISIKEYSDKIAEITEKQQRDRLEAVKTIEEKIVQVLRKKYQKQIELEDERHKNVIDNLNAERDKFEEVINAKLKEIDRQEDAESYEKQLSEMTDEKLKMEQQLNALLLDDSEESKLKQFELSQEINKKEKEIEEFKHKHSVDLRKENLKDQLDANKKMIDDKIKRENEEYEYHKAYLERKLEDDKLYAEAHRLMMKGNYEQLEKMLLEYEDKWGQGMTAMGQSIKDELIANLQDAIDLVGELSSSFRGLDFVDMIGEFESGIGSGGKGGGGNKNSKNNDIGNNPFGMTKSDFSKYLQNKKDWEEGRRQSEAYAQNLELRKKYGIEKDNFSYDQLKNFYHEGGFVGGKPLNPKHEEIARMLKGELTITPTQLDKIAENFKFMIPKFSANIPSLAGVNGRSNINLHFDKLINVEGNMLKDILPSAENTAKQTLNWLDKELKKQGR